MKKLKNITLFAGIAFLLSSCAVVQSPLVGSIYTDVKSPVAVTNNANSSKAGYSQATSILGLFATGDASIQAACNSGNISKIHHVDQHSTSVLGIFATYKVTVYGE
jgi:hypothetical protein